MSRATIEVSRGARQEQLGHCLRVERFSELLADSKQSDLTRLHGLLANLKVSIASALDNTVKEPKGHSI